MGRGWSMIGYGNGTAPTLPSSAKTLKHPLNSVTTP